MEIELLPPTARELPALSSSAVPVPSTRTQPAAQPVSPDAASVSVAASPVSASPVRAESYSRRALLEQLERLTRLHRGATFGELCCGERERTQRCSRCRNEHDVVKARAITVRVLVRDVLDFGRRASRALLEQLLRFAHCALTLTTSDRYSTYCA